MTLEPGTRLGSYEILGTLGAGGMGEVYRARDASLKREVAIKLLPPEVAADPDRLARFEREARVLASLNHPGIATVHGFERAQPQPFLVMELVPGDTLHERLARGAMPIQEALPIFSQIAEALEAAHEKGVVHRDLKPANIKLLLDGRVKVLDFGLAKATAADEGTTSASYSPTLTAAATRRGEIMGTAAYMSPEQARGRPVDRRADVWAFGCVLYEALAGRAAFEGETITDILASVVRSEPDWGALPRATPEPARRLLRRALQKDPKDRLRDMADARLDLGDAMAALQGGGAPGARSGGWTDGEARVGTGGARAGGGEAPFPWLATPAARRRFAFIGTLALAGGFAAGLLVARRAPTVAGRPQMARRVVSLSIRRDPAGPPSAVTISPDGTQIAYGEEREGVWRIVRRRLDSFDGVPVRGTEGGMNPFFSPDGDWIAFFADGKLRKVPAVGGAMTALADAYFAGGGVWGDDDRILFVPDRGPGGQQRGLARVAAAGGVPETITTPDASRGERAHYWPSLLPGGEWILFTVETARGYGIDAFSLKTKERRHLVDEGTRPRYSPSGHILYSDVSAQTVTAVPFDAGRVAIAGVPVGLQVKADYVPNGALSFDISPDGTFVYAPWRLSEPRTVVSVDRHGAVTPLLDKEERWGEPRLSPDGRTLLLRKTAAPDCDLWLYDLARKTLTRFAHEGDSHAPMWSSDGKQILYSLDAGSGFHVVQKAVDDSTASEPLPAGDSGDPTPFSMTADGRLLAYTVHQPGTGFDIWILPMRGDRTPRPFLTSEFKETDPAFSPDGSALAYVSDESGRDEVYVRSYPGPGVRSQVSTSGGSSPKWSGNGRELFYVQHDTVMVVAAETKPAVRVSAPQALFSGNYLFQRGFNFDVTPDGRRFILLKMTGDMPPSDLRVVLGYDEVLRHVAPAAGGSRP